jgi:hypothetical protein
LSLILPPSSACNRSRAYSAGLCFIPSQVGGATIKSNGGFGSTATEYRGR